MAAGKGRCLGCREAVWQDSSSHLPLCSSVAHPPVIPVWSSPLEGRDDLWLTSNPLNMVNMMRCQLWHIIWQRYHDAALRLWVDWSFRVSGSFSGLEKTVIWAAYVVALSEGGLQLMSRKNLRPCLTFARKWTLSTKRLSLEVESSPGKNPDKNGAHLTLWHSFVRPWVVDPGHSL